MRIAITLASLLSIVAIPAYADGDPEAGEKVFRKCKACHMVGEDAKARVGPALNDLLGRQAGTSEGFEGKYSNSMEEMGEGGLVWTEEILFEYLEDPRDYVKGTKMAFAGLKDEQDRLDVIAYLRQFSPDYEPPAAE